MGCWGRATVAPQRDGTHRRVLDAIVHPRSQGKVPMRHPFSVYGNEFAAGGTNRREFIKIITMAAASVGLTSSAATRIAEAATRGLKPSVVWLHFQACTGCTESLLRTSHPAIAELILDLISLDYNETLFAAAGHQAEDALKKATAENAGKYVCIVEGAIPTKDNGIY